MEGRERLGGGRREAGTINIYLYCVCIAAVGLVLMSAERRGFLPMLLS